MKSEFTILSMYVKDRISSPALLLIKAFCQARQQRSHLRIAEDLCQKLRIYASRGSRSLIFRLYRFRWAAEDFIAQSLQKLLFVTVEICRNIDFISYILYFHEYVFEFQT